MGNDNGNTRPDGKASATLAGGCFWCLEAVYVELEGVEKVVSGYAGGAIPNPSYEQVCSGRTGHAEIVQVIRPRRRHLRGSSWRLLHHPRPHHPEPPGQRRRHPVPLRHLLPRRRAEGCRGASHPGDHRCPHLEPSNRDRDRPAHRLLPGRGVPPGLFQEQPVPALLPGRRRTQGRQVPQAVLLQAQEARRDIAAAITVRKKARRTSLAFRSYLWQSRANRPPKAGGRRAHPGGLR